VEMTETANILHNATPQSLVLMDEIGRGTSTFDGLSLAWATAHHIATEIKAFTMFATHYFELTSLAEEVPATVNVHLDATEHDNKLVFMHTVKNGPANKSYGLQVAALAGVPRNVIVAASGYLNKLEQQSGQNNALPTQNELLLMPPPAETDPLRVEFEALSPDELSPREALDIIYQLKKTFIDQ
jgi:DNA mismatch repair protein MutS